MPNSHTDCTSCKHLKLSRVITEFMPLRLSCRSSASAASWKRRLHGMSHVDDSVLRDDRCGRIADSTPGKCNVSLQCGYGGDAKAHQTEQISSRSRTMYTRMASHLQQAHIILHITRSVTTLLLSNNTTLSLCSTHLVLCSYSRIHLRCVLYSQQDSGCGSLISLGTILR